MGFRNELLRLRRQKGWSQEQLAEQLGVSRQAVSKWESGQSCPDVDKLVILSDLFAVSIDSLVKKEEQGAAAEDKQKNHGFYTFHFCYEFKSKRKLFGLPLIHVNLGPGFYVAKGVFAIGTISVGLLSIRLLSLGLLSVGVLTLGLIGIGNLSIGVLVSVGGIAIGTLAVGGIAVGFLALGGVSAGMFSVGGAAFASHIAVGGYADGHIAIGQTARGARTLIIDEQFHELTARQVKSVINQEYPGLWRPIIDFMTFLFR